MDGAALVPLSEDFIDAIVRQDGGRAWHQDEAKWQRYLAEHLAGQRHTLIALVHEQPVAYGSLVVQSKYLWFSESRTPEISDLVVAEPWRGCGLATRLVASLESEAGRRGYERIGLGVGLYADYGPAQRLYAKLGFVMNGHGLTIGAERRIAEPGSMVKVDDDLVLWLTKSIRHRANADPDLR